MAESRLTGRPRSERARQAILAAAFDHLVERGYDSFAIEAVAAAAGVGKTTIYRWWSGKAELAVDAFFHGTEEELRFPDTGTAAGDFHAQITELAALLRGGRGKALVAMLAGARGDAALRQALNDRWLGPRRQWGADRMQRALESGELTPGTSPAVAMGLLYGPLYTPLLFGGDVPSADYVEASVALASKGIFS